MTRKKTEEQDIEPAQSKDGSNIEPQAPASNSPAKAAPTARSQGKGYALVAVVYLLGLCMGALDMGIVNPARTVIQNTLSVDDSLGVWIITIYTLAYAVSIPIMGKLADRHGRKGVYLLCILLFGIGSALCGVAQDLGNFWILIGARVIQALGGGGIMPVATAEFGTAFPEEKRGMALGIVGMVYGLASILGPTVGSAILEVFGATQWQFIFYVNIPICIIVLILGVVLRAFAAPLSALFGVEGKAQAQAVECLRFLSWCYPIFAVYLPFNGMYQGVGDPAASAAGSLIALSVRVAGSYLLVYCFNWDYHAIWTPYIPGWSAALIFVLIHYFRGSWKKHSLVRGAPKEG